MKFANQFLCCKGALWPKQHSWLNGWLTHIGFNNRALENENENAFISCFAQQ